MKENKVVIEWWVQSLPDGRKDETIWPYIDLECMDWGHPIRIWERSEEHKKLTPILSLMQGAQGEDRYEWCRDYTLTKEEVFSISGGGTMTIYYNPPGLPQSNGLMSGDQFPSTENINVREHYNRLLTVKFIVPGMEGFEELRALVQLMGTFEPDGKFYRADISGEEIVGVLRAAGGEGIIRKRRAP